MKASLIIPTRNRAQQLMRCLASVKAAYDPSVELELVVADNGSTDDTKAVVDRFAGEAGFEVRYVFAEKPGGSYARNRGIEASSAEMLIFTDDDCLLRGDFFSEFARTVDLDQFQYGMGQLLRHNKADDIRVAHKAISNLRLIPAHTRVLATGLIHSANMFCHRSVFDRCGLFDENMGAGTPFPCEDIELASRASRAGFVGALLPSIVVFHDHGRRTGSLEARKTIESYDLGRGAYYAKLLTEDMHEIWAHWAVSFSRSNDLGALSRELLAASQYLALAAEQRAPRKPAKPGVGKKRTSRPHPG